MRFHKLGQGALEVSEICLGTMTFGQQNTIEEAHQQLDHAFERGINFIDTAEMYPVPARGETQGRTESFVGEWLTRRPRDKVVLATKIAASGRPIPWLRGGRLSVNRENVQQALNDSLRRLQTDYVDLYQIHWPDRYVPLFGGGSYDPANERVSTSTVEQLQAIGDVIEAGKVRHWGLSNETAWGVSEFVRTAREMGLPPPITIQNAYNLINRHFEHGLSEVCHREHVDLLPYSVLGFGYLTGKHVEGPAPHSRVSLFAAQGFAGRYQKQNVPEAVAAYVKLARSHGLTPGALAHAFVRSRWFVKSTIIGATTLAQLQENIDAFELSLSPELLAGIEDIHARYPNPTA
jgi:aryl-alcohol dehydrogenase-like predicted oxidoreductase